MARAYRPRHDTTTPLEVLRLLVDEYLNDQPGRTHMRPTWDGLSTDDQRQVIGRADSVEGITAAQHWIVGGPQSEQDCLLGAVVSTLGAHAPNWGTP